MPIKDDPALYREMSAPFADKDAGNDAVAAFFADVEAARKKHRISDAIVLVEVGMLTNGEETRGAASLYLGSSANILPMLASAYGTARGAHEDRLALLLSRARRSKP